MLSFYFAPSYSGSAVQAYNLSRLLLGKGVVPEIVSANLTDSAGQELLHGLAIRRLPLIKRKAFRIPSFALTLTWYLVRHRRDYDIVHAHGVLPHAVAGVVAAALGKKSVLKIAMAHSDIAFQSQGRIWGRVNRFLVRRFDRYVAISDEIRRECLEQNLDATRVVVIPNGVDTDLFRPAESESEKHAIRRELGMPDKPIVCFVGIIDARKNVDAVLRIWREVVRSGAEGRLVLIGPEPEGPDGRPTEYCRSMRRYVEDEGLTDSVAFVGRQSNVAAYLRGADIFLFPSKREGMPNVVLEAMASGLACIVSRIGGATDLIQDGADGFLFDVNDETGMAVTLNRILRQPGLARSLGLAARRSALARFSLDATAERYLALYRELLSEGSAPAGARVRDG